MTNSSAQGRSLETELVKAVERSASAEQGIQQEFGGLVGTLTHHQRRLLDDLCRLSDSLRSPEAILDRGNYSRPFPPHQRAPQAK